MFVFQQKGLKILKPSLIIMFKILREKEREREWENDRNVYRERYDTFIVYLVAYINKYLFKN